MTVVDSFFRLIPSVDPVLVPDKLLQYAVQDYDDVTIENAPPPGQEDPKLAFDPRHPKIPSSFISYDFF
ncbi:hypothetical protein QTP88_022542 [Uroleucon formosanum]